MRDQRNARLGSNDTCVMAVARFYRRAVINRSNLDLELQLLDHLTEPLSRTCIRGFQSEPADLRQLAFQRFSTHPRHLITRQ